MRAHTMRSDYLHHDSLCMDDRDDNRGSVTLSFRTSPPSPFKNFPPSMRGWLSMSFTFDWPGDRDRNIYATYPGNTHCERSHDRSHIFCISDDLLERARFKIKYSVQAGQDSTGGTDNEQFNPAHELVPILFRIYCLAFRYCHTSDWAFLVFPIS